jgi:hypothetical protein
MKNFILKTDFPMYGSFRVVILVGEPEFLIKEFKKLQLKSAGSKKNEILEQKLTHGTAGISTLIPKIYTRSNRKLGVMCINPINKNIPELIGLFAHELRHVVDLFYKGLTEEIESPAYMTGYLTERFTEKLLREE